jgi:hypothetical protein
VRAGIMNRIEDEDEKDDEHDAQFRRRMLSA